VPSFAPDGGATLVLARGLAACGLLAVAGNAAFTTMVAPRAFVVMAPADRAAVERLLRRWTHAAVGFGGLGLIGWFVAVVADLAQPQTVADWAEGAAAVLGTTFGRVIALQALLLGAAGLATGRWPGLVAATAAAIAEVGHGHAYAMAHGPGLLEVAEALHLASAGAWLGGLPPLLIITCRAPPAAAAAAARWFSPLGKICVGLTAGSALVQGVILVGSLTALAHTAYGWTALGKLVLFGVLVGFAILNRYRLAPALCGRNPGLARRRLIASLAMQTFCGVLVVFAAALLGQLAPAMPMAE
jgi:putative copper export protein